MAERATILVHGFETTYELDHETGKYDRPVDWVSYSPAHAAMYSTIKERVEWLRPKRNLRNDDEGKKADFLNWRWSQIEPAYKAWKEGLEIPVNGTPLGAWGAIGPQHVKAFQAVGIKTVEMVAEVTDGVISKIQLPNVRELKRQAELFLSSREKSGEIARFEALERGNADLREQLAAAMELLEAQKPRRGRPPKEAVEEVEEAA